MINGHKEAYLSRCGNYRYLLTRGKCDDPLIFIMLNPSTADHVINDPTIKRCLGFAESNGKDGILVLNLYAFRSTNPSELKTTSDPVGPENDIFFDLLMARSVVCAWGALAGTDRVREVVDTLRVYGTELNCLGVNKDGSPKHPLYIPKNSLILKWEPRL